MKFHLKKIEVYEEKIEKLTLKFKLKATIDVIVYTPNTNVNCQTEKRHTNNIVCIQCQKCSLLSFFLSPALRLVTEFA